MIDCLLARRPASYSGFVVLAIFTVGCSSSKAASSALTPDLWGTVKPVVSVKELMRDMIGPPADNIFDAVSVVEDEHGIVERMPKRDADWEQLRIGATAMAEGSYLLKMRRPFTPSGDMNNSIGPDAVELAPDQITAK